MTTTTPESTTTSTSVDAGTTGRTGNLASLSEFGVGGFDQCWYPIALSSEVAAGQVVGADFLDGRVVCFRGDDGVASVVSAYCRHLGTDLTQGEVVGNELRCNFHYWCYDRAGGCTKIPASDRIPEDSSLFA